MTKHLRKADIPPAAIAQQPDEIESLNARVRELAARDKELVAEQLRIERAGHGSAREDAALQEAAARMLNGETGPAAVQTSHERLAEIVTERRTIAVALALAERKMIELALNRVVERRRAAADEWAENVRSRALLVVQLQKLNREAVAILEPLRDNNGYTAMPCSFEGRPLAQFLLGTGLVVGGDAYDFLRVAVEGGFVTRGELDKVRGVS